MSHIDPGPLSTYNSLLDRNLAGYFSNTRQKRHLRKSGLVSRKGHIVSESTYRLSMARKEHKKHVKDLLAQAIVHKTLDMERHRQCEIKKKLEEIAKIELVRRVRSDRVHKREHFILPYFSPRVPKHHHPKPVVENSWTQADLSDSDDLDFAAERGRKGDEELLPYLSPRGQNQKKNKGKGRPQSGPNACSKAQRGSGAQRPASAPNDRAESPSSDYDHPNYSSKMRPIYIDADGYPVHPDDLERRDRSRSPDGESSAMSTSSRTTSKSSGSGSSVSGGSHSPYPTARIDTRNLYALDNTALREYAVASHQDDQGQTGPSPYHRSVYPPHVPAPPKGIPKTTPRGRRPPIPKREGKSEKNMGTLMLHRVEPAFKLQNQLQSFCEVTMHYFGSNIKLDREMLDPYHEIQIEQQHCGGSTLAVFKEKILPKSNFSFISRRHRGYPFSLTFYINGVMDVRLSTCCEYKHKKSFKIGGKTGHFGLVSVTGGQKCYRCIVDEEMENKKKQKKQQDDDENVATQIENESEDENDNKQDNKDEDKKSTTCDSEDGIRGENDDANDKNKDDKDEKYDDDFEDDDAKKDNKDDKYSDNDFDDETEVEVETPKNTGSDDGKQDVKGLSDDLEKDDNQQKQHVVVPVEDRTPRKDEDSDGGKSDRSDTSSKSDSSDKSKKSDASSKSNESNKSDSSKKSDTSIKSDKSKQQNEDIVDEIKESNNNQSTKVQNSADDTADEVKSDVEDSNNQSAAATKVQNSGDDTETADEVKSDVEDSDSSSSSSSDSEADEVPPNDTTTEIEETDTEKVDATPRHVSGTVKPLYKSPEEIDLSNTKLTSEQLEEVCSELRRSKDVKLINLRNCSLGDDSVEKLSQALKSSPSQPKLLNLNVNNISDGGARHVADILDKKPDIQMLLLHGNSLSDSGVSALVDGIVQHQKQTMYDKTAKNVAKGAIKEAVRSDSMQSLVSEGSTSTQQSEGGKLLALTELDLGECQMGTSGAMKIGELIECTKLTTLNLSANTSIGQNGWAAIGKALKDNSTVTHLCLDFCEMGDDNMDILSEYIADNSTLKTLDLEWNGLSDEGAQKVLDAVISNPSIQYVKLTPGNTFDGDILNDINEILNMRQGDD